MIRKKGWMTLKEILCVNFMQGNPVTQSLINKSSTVTKICLLRSSILRAYVTPAGLETMALTEQQQQKLQLCEND